MLFNLVAAVSAVAAAASAGALPEPERALDEEILVTGARADTYRPEAVQVGGFRNRAILDTPASVAVIPRALLDAQGALGLEEALRNTPGITQQSTSPVTTNNFVSRGVLLNARTNYRLNGSLQVINLAPIPIENKQRVEMLRGVSALYYGLSTPSGIVNAVTKRAGARAVTALTLTTDAEGSAGAALDAGRRFGADDRFGLRVNGAVARVETPIDGVGGDRAMASAAADWDASDRLSLKADVEWYRRRVDEPGGITLPNPVGAINGVGGRIVLPAVPDPHHRYAPTGVPTDTRALNALGRAEYALADHWSLRAEAGVARTLRDRTTANLGTINLATGEGRLSGFASGRQLYRNDYLRAELTGTVDTGGIAHDLLVGVARNRQVQAQQLQRSYAPVAQNLYDPRPITDAALRFTTTRTNPRSVNIDTGAYVLDMAKIGPRWLAIAGVRRVDYATHQAGRDFTIRTWTPTAGLVFRPTARTSLYGTYIEGLESAGIAPDGTTNAGDVLAPVRSRQAELGARAELGGALASLALFRIDRGLAYTDATGRYVVNGKARHCGVEASVQGSPAAWLSLAASAQYLDAVQRRTGLAAQDGRQVENTPRWSGSAFAELRPRRLPGWTLNGGVYVTGRRFADAQNRAVLPGYATLGLGTGYRVALRQGGAIQFRVNADNVTDARYWSTGGATLYVGLARTVRGSMAIEL